MFRTIKNIIEGRIKTHDKILSIEEALTLLDGLDGNVRGNIHYYRYESWGIGPLASGSGWEKIQEMGEVAPRVMANFVNFFSREDEEHYTNIRHQVYSGSVNEKHYLDLACGKIEKEYDRVVGTIKRKEYPDIKALILFMRRLK